MGPYRGTPSSVGLVDQVSSAESVLKVILHRCPSAQAQSTVEGFALEA